MLTGRMRTLKGLEARVPALSPEQIAFAEKLENGAVPHALIIEGPRGCGKHAFALWCAQALLCTASVRRPCGECAGCKRVQNGFHPDLHLYGEEDPIGVGDVRELIRETGLVPMEGERSVYVLSHGEKMQPAAQNALLKIFEEPPAGVTILLLTESRRALLPTVRSRGQRITLSGLTDEELRQELHRRDPRASAEELDAAVRVARGSVGEAVDFLGKNARKQREIAREWLDALFSGDAYRLVGTVAASMSKEKRETLLPLFDVFLRMLFDLLLARSGGEPLLLEGSEARSLAWRTTRRALSRMCERTITCRDRLEANGNVTVALSCLASELHAIAGRTITRDRVRESV